MFQKKFSKFDIFETNALIREAERTHKAGDFALRTMIWLISARYFEKFNYHDLIATALTLMKGEKLYVRKDLFSLVNE